MKKLPPKLLYVTLVSGLAVIILAVMFLLAGNADAFTDHRFMVNTDNQGDFFLDSFPEEMVNIPKPHYDHYLICLCREKNVWDDIGTMAGIQNCSDEKTLAATEKIKALQEALDKIVPSKKLICFSFILCYHDSVIYFQEDYTFEEMCVIAEKLNVERQNHID